MTNMQIAVHGNNRGGRALAESFLDRPQLRERCRLHGVDAVPGRAEEWAKPLKEAGYGVSWQEGKTEDCLDSLPEAKQRCHLLALDNLEGILAVVRHSLTTGEPVIGLFFQQQAGNLEACSFELRAVDQKVEAIRYLEALQPKTAPGGSERIFGENAPILSRLNEERIRSENFRLFEKSFLKIEAGLPSERPPLLLSDGRSSRAVQLLPQRDSYDYEEVRLALAETASPFLYRGQEFSTFDLSGGLQRYDGRVRSLDASLMLRPPLISAPPPAELPSLLLPSWRSSFQDESDAEFDRILLSD